MTFSEPLDSSSKLELQQLHQAVLEAFDGIKALQDELCTGINYSYINQETTPPLLKIGFTSNISQRGKNHKRRGYQYVDHVTGSQANEKRLKKNLFQRGIKPVSGDETFMLDKELLKALVELDWPIGDLATQLDRDDIQTNLDLNDDELFE